LNSHEGETNDRRNYGVETNGKANRDSFKNTLKGGSALGRSWGQMTGKREKPSKKKRWCSLTGTSTTGATIAGKTLLIIVKKAAF